MSIRFPSALTSYTHDLVSENMYTLVSTLRTGESYVKAAVADVHSSNPRTFTLVAPQRHLRSFR